MPTTLHYYGHSCFSLERDGTLIIIDPFLRENPTIAEPPRPLRPAAILVTHGHVDHLGDAVPLAKVSRAPIVATFELAEWCRRQGAETVIGANLGGTVRFPWGSVKLVPALHSSSVADGANGQRMLGEPCGFLIRFFDHVIYHAGDTALFGDMALIGKTPVDVALLPIGDYFTMGPDDAVTATKLLSPATVIPMHYNTWETIAQDPGEFRRQVQQRTHAQCVPLEPGQEWVV